MSSKSNLVWGERSLIGFPVYYAFVPDEKTWHKEMKKLKAVEEWPCKKKHARMSQFETNDKTICLVTINREIAAEHTEAEVAALIVHEAMHVWRVIREEIGEDYPSSEFEAYSIQTIFHWLYKGYLDSQEQPSTN